MEDNNKKYTIMDLWIMSRTPVALAMRGSINDLNKKIGCYYPNMNIKVKLPIGYKIGGIKNE